MEIRRHYTMRNKYPSKIFCSYMKKFFVDFYKSFLQKPDQEKPPTNL